MAEYITKEFALSCVDSFLSKTGMPIAAQYFYDCFRECEVSDVQPVKHGKWIDTYTWTMFHEFKSSGRGEHFWCSECEQGQKQKSNYCPNCGADMRGDAE